MGLARAGQIPLGPWSSGCGADNVSPEVASPATEPLSGLQPAQPGPVTRVHTLCCSAWVGLAHVPLLQRHPFVILHFKVSFEVSRTVPRIGTRCFLHMRFGGQSNTLWSHPPTPHGLRRGTSLWPWLPAAGKEGLAQLLVQSRPPWMTWLLSPEPPGFMPRLHLVLCVCLRFRFLLCK